MATRLIGVNYGHSGSGKVYDYETDKQYRAGDVVVVPVTHPKSGKEYNTLAVVKRTTSSEKEVDRLTGALDEKGIAAKNTGQRLAIAQAQGLDVKADGDVTVRTLPGYERMEQAIKDGAPLVTRQNWGGVDNSYEGIMARRAKREARLITRNTRGA